MPKQGFGCPGYHDSIIQKQLQSKPHDDRRRSACPTESRYVTFSRDDVDPRGARLNPLLGRPIHHRI